VEQVEAADQSRRRWDSPHRWLLAVVTIALVAGGWWGWREWRTDDCFGGELRVEVTYGRATRMVIDGEEAAVNGGPTLRLFDADGNAVDRFGCPIDDAPSN
jgi:hypothetical protein